MQSEELTRLRLLSAFGGKPEILFKPSFDPSGSFAVDFDLSVSPLKGCTDAPENLCSFFFADWLFVVRRLPCPDMILPNRHGWHICHQDFGLNEHRLAGFSIFNSSSSEDFDRKTVFALNDVESRYVKHGLNQGMCTTLTPVTFGFSRSAFHSVVK